MAVRAEAGPGDNLCFQNPGPTIPPKSWTAFLSGFSGWTPRAGAPAAARGWALPLRNRSWSCTAGGSPPRAGTSGWNFTVTLPPQENRKILK